MGNVGIDPGGSRFHQSHRGVAQRPGGVDDVVEEDAASPIDVANYIHNLRDARAFATLIDDDEIGVETASNVPGAQHAADIGRDDDQVPLGQAFADVLHQHRRGVEVIDRDVEEPLDLRGMEVEGEHPIGAGGGDQIGDQLG